MDLQRVILLVLDSVGVGGAADAAHYGDAGAHTLGNIGRHVGGLHLPNLERLGLGNLETVAGVEPAANPAAAFGRLAEVSAGKDTTTGHWELAGLVLREPFATFPNGFPPSVIEDFVAATGHQVLGNRAASGTKIIEELGQEHLQTGALIVYTSADSVFQIAAHEEVIPLKELYRCCEVARHILDPHRVGRVIARPFIGGDSGSGDSGGVTAPFERTAGRRDFSIAPPSSTVLENVATLGLPVIGVGKISDIFAGRGVTEKISTRHNADGMAQTLAAMKRFEKGLVMTNLVDFDVLYGHRRDPHGYAGCLQEFDAWVPQLLAQTRPGKDLVLLTADHGNDPTMPGSDHTREQVPLLAYGPPQAAGIDLGLRETFADVAATISEALGAEPTPDGHSFLQKIC